METSLRCSKCRKVHGTLEMRKILKKLPDYCRKISLILISCRIMSAIDQKSCIMELQSGDIVKTSIITCRHSVLDHISKSLATLRPTEIATNPSPLVVNVSSVDISECDIHTLPNLFAQFENNVETIRVANSRVQFVAGNAFTGLENRLKNLDMSGNKLVTLPSAIQNLKQLVTLDISDNNIRIFPTDFAQSPLSELRASFNQLGFLQGESSGPKTSLIKSIPRLEIAPDVFDLTSVASTLEVVDLSFNGLHAIPKQFFEKSSLSFPRLRILILSGNRISDIPLSLVENLVDLQSLHLDSNIIRTLKFDPFPSNIKLLTLKDNPLQCNCDIMWLLDLLFRNSTLTVRLPPCSTPFYIRDLTLANINDNRLCPSELAEDAAPRAPHVVYVTDRDLASFHLGLFQSLHLMDFTLANYQKNQPVKEGSIYSDSVQGLTAPRFYLVCIAPVEDDVHYVHLNNCRGATTLQETSQPIHTSFTTNDHTLTTPITSSQPEQMSQQIQFNMSATTTSDNVVIKWTVFDEEPVWLEEEVKSPLNFKALFSRPKYLWRIKVRPFGSQRLFQNHSLLDPADVLNPNGNHTSGTTLTGLEPSSAYILCVSLLQTPSQRRRDSQQDNESCLEVTTDSRQSQTYSRAQMATAAVAASASAAICTALVALCIKFRNQQKSDEEMDNSPLPISDLLQRSSSFRLNLNSTATTSSAFLLALKSRS
uniref:Fibronectin type-III domain-containing protein n=1 Tax=Strigamia maritima TaxID=126957 RepID=T1JLL3_STRMM